MALRALLLPSASTIPAQGAALADIPLCDRFEAVDITSLIHTGDTLAVKPDSGQVTVSSFTAEQAGLNSSPATICELYQANEIL